MSGRAVKISEELFEAARRESEVMSRSLARQIEHWAALGRSIERSGHVSQRRVAQFLEGRFSFDDLNALEGALATDRVIDSLEQIRPAPDFLASLRQSGAPVSGVVEASGEIVRVHSDGRIERVKGSERPATDG